jgi:hypothetical protein
MGIDSAVVPAVGVAVGLADPVFDPAHPATTNAAQVIRKIAIIVDVLTCFMKCPASLLMAFLIMIICQAGRPTYDMKA